MFHSVCRFSRSLTLAAVLLCLAPLVQAGPESGIRQQVSAALASPAGDRDALLSAALSRVYQQHQFAPLWLNNGQLTARARAALAALQAAGDEGLSAQDYGVAALEQARSQLAADSAQAEFDYRLSRAVARFARDLSIGRVDPQQLDLAIDLSARRARLPERLVTVLESPVSDEALAALRPALPAYTALRAQLPHFRELASRYPGRPALPALPGKKLEPGQHWDGTPALAQWLVVLGDLPAAAAGRITTQYTGEIVEAMRHFQQRHGLGADGVIGAQSYQALVTPLSVRVSQIELALERLRWTDPALMHQRFLMVNIPQFTLWAYEPGKDGKPAARLRMAVVVGKAGDTETPILTKQLSTVVFNPYWNVPRSIAIKELVPKLRQHPAYLDEQDMEMVGNDGFIRTGLVASADISSIVMGEYRIRQRPGPRNALGGIKFVFPNDDSIYMHDTPQKALFARDRRDFSHGCIRVSDPMALALYALESSGSTWDEARINAIIKPEVPAGQEPPLLAERHIPLKEHMPVLIAYMTANAESDGTVTFAPDIYVRDKMLAAALQGRR